MMKYEKLMMIFFGNTNLERRWEDFIRVNHVPVKNEAEKGVAHSKEMPG